MTASHPLRHRLLLILELKGNKDKKTAMVFSWLLTLMVLSNVLAVILESVPSFEAQYATFLTVFDAISVAFFSTEYLLRIWTAAEKRHPGRPTALRRRMGYVLGFHGLIDLIAVLPFFLQCLQVFRPSCVQYHQCLLYLLTPPPPDLRLAERRKLLYFL